MATKKQVNVKAHAVTPRPPGVYLVFEGDCYQAFGFSAGDNVTLVLVDDPRPSETLFAYCGKQWTIGRFVGFDVEGGEREIRIEALDGPKTYLATATFYRAESITRKVERPAPDTKVPAGPTPADLRRIKELRERLDELYEPENERAYFRVLTEIHQLEHEADADEWPEELP